MPDRFTIVVLIFIFLVGCNSTKSTQLQESASEFESEISSENLFLDVAISLFNPGIDATGDSIFPEIRKAEAKYIPQMLKNTFQSQGRWGVVRLVPTNDDLLDLHITGNILFSDGETLRLLIQVQDATGYIWLRKTFVEDANTSTYQKSWSAENEPFKSLYEQIENDIYSLLRKASAQKRKFIKTISEIRFAKDFDSQTYSSYLHEEKNGRRRLVRQPSSDDPQFNRIRQVRLRNSMFVDILQEEYETFVNDIGEAYFTWRQKFYHQKIMYRNSLAESQNKIYHGAVQALNILNPFTLFKLISNPSEQTGAGFAVDQIESGLQIRRATDMYKVELQELGKSLDSFAKSHNVSIDNYVMSLEGTVGQRYNQFRQILREIYLNESGIILHPK